MTATTPLRCFLVEDFDDMWTEIGEYEYERNVGALKWESHRRNSKDTSPRPMPHLYVVTPAGICCLDCPASDPPHGYWSREGEPPNITVSPSLNVNHNEWHGFITRGWIYAVGETPPS